MGAANHLPLLLPVPRGVGRRIGNVRFHSRDAGDWLVRKELLGRIPGRHPDTGQEVRCYNARPDGIAQAMEAAMKD